MKACWVLLLFVFATGREIRLGCWQYTSPESDGGSLSTVSEKRREEKRREEGRWRII
jgi:hypothetical protein